MVYIYIAIYIYICIYICIYMYTYIIFTQLPLGVEGLPQSFGDYRPEHGDLSQVPPILVLTIGY